MKASTIRETPFALCLVLVTFASRFIFWEKRTAGAPLAFCWFAVVPLRGGRPFYTTRKAARASLPSSCFLLPLPLVSNPARVINSHRRPPFGGRLFRTIRRQSLNHTRPLCPLPNSPYLCKRFFIDNLGSYRRLIEMFCGRSLFVGAAAFVSAQRRKSAFQASTRKPRRRKDGKQARKGRFSFVCCILSPFACNVSECNEKQRHGRYLRVKGLFAKNREISRVPKNAARE